MPLIPDELKLGDRLRIRYFSRKSGGWVERVGPIVHIIAPGEVPDKRWYMRAGATGDPVSEVVNEIRRIEQRTAPVVLRAIAARRFVVRTSDGNHNVFPEQALRYSQYQVTRA